MSKTDPPTNLFDPSQFAQPQPAAQNTQNNAPTGIRTKIAPPPLPGMNAAGVATPQPVTQAPAPPSTTQPEPASLQPPPAQPAVPQAAAPQPAAPAAAPAQQSNTVGTPLEILLERLTTMMRAPVTRDAIRAGLPIEDGLIAPRGHERAIKQAGFKASLVKPLSRKSTVPAPFLIPLPNGRFAIGLRWNLDGSLDVMGLQEGEAQAPKTFPAQAVPAFLPEKVYKIKRQLTKASSKPEEHKLTGIARAESWFWPVVRSQWKGYVYAGVATALLNIMLVLGSFYTMQVYDRVLPTLSFDTLWVLSIGVTIAYAFGFIIENLKSYFLDTAGRKIDMKASSDLFSRVMAIKAKDRPLRSNSFAHTFREFENVREFFSSMSMSGLIDVPFSLLFIFAIYLIAGPLCIIPILFGPGMVIINFALQLFIERSIRANMQSGADKNSVLLEGLSGMETIKSLTAESTFQHRWEDAVEIAADSSRTMRMVSVIANSVSKFFTNMSRVAILIYGVYLVAANEISMGAIIGATMLVARALAPYTKMSSLLARSKQVRISLDVIEEFTSKESEWVREGDFIDRPVQDGSITFHKVTFTYPETSVSIINNLNMKIAPGERVGIIGPSGSGKSTLSKLMLGIYEPDNGVVQVGGIENRQYNPRTLRRAIAYASQDPFIFSGTLLDNVRFGSDQATKDDILVACKQTGVDVFTANHPDGMMMDVGEMGRNLSGGQRQALSLARTFVKNGQVLILDEPTNSLDGYTENMLLRTLQEQPKDRTIILVTHQPRLLKVVDRVIAMEKGSIVMDGGRDDVLRRLSGAASRAA